MKKFKVNKLKLVPLTFRSWDEIRYYNEFMRACRVGEENAKESFSFHDGDLIHETFLINN